MVLRMIFITSWESEQIRISCTMSFFNLLLCSNLKYGENINLEENCLFSQGVIVCLLYSQASDSQVAPIHESSGNHTEDGPSFLSTDPWLKFLLGGFFSFKRLSMQVVFAIRIGISCWIYRVDNPANCLVFATHFHTTCMRCRLKFDFLLPLLNTSFFNVKDLTVALDVQLMGPSGLFLPSHSSTL